VGLMLIMSFDHLWSLGRAAFLFCSPRRLASEPEALPLQQTEAPGSEALEDVSAASAPGHHCPRCLQSWEAGSAPFGGICPRCDGQLEDGILASGSLRPVEAVPSRCQRCALSWETGAEAVSSLCPRCGGPLDVESSASRLEDPGATDVGYFHQFVNFSTVVGTLARVRGLADAIHGRVQLQRWTVAEHEAHDLPAHVQPLHSTGALTVCTKIIPNATVDRFRLQDGPMSERDLHRGRAPRHLEDALNEIGVFQMLSETRRSHENVLKMLACFRDERNTYLVTEFCDGGELFSVAANLRRFDTYFLKLHMFGLLKATQFLHACNIGHRDISLENLLIKDGRCKLMDFGQAVLLRRRGVELRYFRLTGKPYYRAPEAYVPGQQELPFTCPEGFLRTGDQMQLSVNGYLCEVACPAEMRPGQVCTVSPIGYAVAPIDVFACGVALFILYMKVPPWNNALQSDASFRFVRAEGLQGLLQHWCNTPARPMPEPAMVDLLSGMLAFNPAERWGMERCRRSHWFSDLAFDLVRAGHSEEAESWFGLEPGNDLEVELRHVSGEVLASLRTASTSTGAAVKTATARQFALGSLVTLVTSSGVILRDDQQIGTVAEDVHQVVLTAVCGRRETRCLQCRAQWQLPEPAGGLCPHCPGPVPVEVLAA